MNTTEIREFCYKCGHRSLLLMKPAPLPTDFCDAGQMECGKIKSSDPSMRIPKTKQTRHKEALE